MSDESDFDKWVSQISEWQDYVHDVPSLAREHIQKGRVKLDAQAKNPLKSFLEDPLAIQYSMGYKDRRHSLSYDFLKRIPHQLAIVAAILQTRCNQVAAFSVPYRSSKSVGFAIKHKDPSHLTTKSEQKFIKELESFIYSCGRPDPNPHSDIDRDDFEHFLKKIVRDSLMYDQACLEVVPARDGTPYEFYAVDASTIRIAATGPGIQSGPGSIYHDRSVYNGMLEQNLETGPFRTLHLSHRGAEGKAKYVQLINGQIANAYTSDEMVFGVRNPRTDIYIQGYGYGELEQLVTIITAHLYAEEYNRRFFMQGSSPKGIMVLKGDTMTPDMLEGFRREWRSNLEGTSNAWKTPIMQSEQGLDWIDLHPTNRDMEYNSWVEYLLKITCFPGYMNVTGENDEQIPISEVKPGQRVFSHTGKLRKVKNVQISNYNGNLIHIKLKSGKVIDTTPEHPFYVCYHRVAKGVQPLVLSDPEWKKAEDLDLEHDYLIVPKNEYAKKIPSLAWVDYSDDYFLVPIEDIWTSTFLGKVYNLEVEGEHTYQVEGCAVHNCAVFLVDPAELNFDLHGGVQQTPLFESSQEWKLKASRDKGLKPLLRFIAKLINKHIIAKIDDHFMFEFLGLEDLTEQEKHTLRTEQVTSYRTLNEIRREDDLPDLKYGDIPMSPAYLQHMGLKQAEEQQKNQDQLSLPAGGPGDPGADAAQTAPQEGQPSQVPQYADSFGKSLYLSSGGKFLEIDLSELDEWKSSRGFD